MSKLATLKIIQTYTQLMERQSLRCFLSFALRIPTVHDFCVISEHACIQNVRDFPQTKLDSKINARFFLNVFS